MRFFRNSLLLGSLLLTSPAWAEGDFNTWLQDFRAEALSKGISQATLDISLTGIEPIPRVIALDRAQPEFKLGFEAYWKRVSPQGRIDKGKAKLKEHAELFKEIAEAYKVQPHFIAALWAIETDYGRVTGGFSVINALASLAFDGRRSSFFRIELLEALKIVDQGHIEAGKMQGSWAGAMGQCQFMPSSFNRFATDYDKDGKKDIWGNTGDVIASIANYLSSSGWNNQQTWGREVRLPKKFDSSLVDLKIRKKLVDWGQLGVKSKNGNPLPSKDIEASLVSVNVDSEGKSKRYFLVYDNYRVILKWNRSANFAVAAGMLADRLGSK